MDKTGLEPFIKGETLVCHWCSAVADWNTYWNDNLDRVNVCQRHYDEMQGARRGALLCNLPDWAILED